MEIFHGQIFYYSCEDRGRCGFEAPVCNQKCLLWDPKNQEGAVPTPNREVHLHYPAFTALRRLGSCQKRDEAEFRCRDAAAVISSRYARLKIKMWAAMTGRGGRLRSADHMMSCVFTTLIWITCAGASWGSGGGELQLPGRRPPAPAGQVTVGGPMLQQRVGGGSRRVRLDVRL